jgi:phage terminase Nu1 subunit (DNA packaging protein)
VNKTEFARIVGYSPRQISKWINQGLPVEGAGRKGSPLRISTPKAIAWLIDREVKRQAGLSPDEKRKTKEAEDLRFRAARADHAELDLAIRRGQVTPSDDTADVLNEVAVIYSSQLDGLGGRLASELAANTSPEGIYQILFTEGRRIRSATAERLREFARGLSGRVSGSGGAATGQNA